MGMDKLLIARLMNPQAMNIFEIPSPSIHGVMAKGIAMLITFRRKAMPVNASPTICGGDKIVRNTGQRKTKVSDGITHIRVAVNHQGQSCVPNTSKTESEERAAKHGQCPMHALIRVRLNEANKEN